MRIKGFLIILFFFSIISFAQLQVFEVNPQDFDKITEAIDIFMPDGSKYYTDAKTGTIMVDVNEENESILKKLLNRLSTSGNPRQVLIEARIVEIETGKDNSFGFEWELQKKFDLSSGSSDYSLSQDINLPSYQYTTGGTFRLSTLNSSEFNSIMNSMDGNENVRVISNPRIFVKDGKQAHILIGQKIPYVNSVVDNGVVSSNTKFFDAGVKLNVTPTVLGKDTGDIVNLKIRPEISNFVSWSPGDNQPIIDTVSVDTEVMVKDKKVVVIGGLMKVDIEESQMKVPLLSDIPILGRAFRRNHSKKVRKEIVIFLTPQIQKDLQRENQSDRFFSREPKEQTIWQDMSSGSDTVVFK